MLKVCVKLTAFITILLLSVGTKLYAEENAEKSELGNLIASIPSVNSSSEMVCESLPDRKAICSTESINSCLKSEGGKSCLTSCKLEPSEKYCRMEALNKCIGGEGGKSCYKKYCKGTHSTGKFTPKNITDNSVNTRLPHSGYGFECYDDHDNYVYGTPRTIQRVKELGRRVVDKTGLKVWIGDISRKGGGYLPPHSTHRSGNDVDIANMGKTDSCESYDIGDRCYNRSAMKAVLEEIIVMGGVKKILFNDAVIARELNNKYGNIISSSYGHHHHAHVEWK